jgi:16S rRNA (guanine966-N2)-methyltransferase
VRIISGTHKGRRINPPKKLPVRPTTDRAKEGLFNILNNQFDFGSLTIMDLFTGTGSISYEFCSRGVSYVLAIDDSYHCIEFVNKTSEELNFPIKAIKSEVLEFLKTPKKTFNLIFADPPYDWGDENYNKMIEFIFKNKWIDKNGLVILEHSKKMKIISKREVVMEKKYGDNVFTFLK